MLQERLAALNERENENYNVRLELKREIHTGTVLDSSGLGISTLRDEVKETGLLRSRLHNSCGCLHEIKPTRIPA